MKNKLSHCNIDKIAKHLCSIVEIAKHLSV